MLHRLPHDLSSKITKAAHKGAAFVIFSTFASLCDKITSSLGVFSKHPYPLTQNPLTVGLILF
jgi:hypothetical protein